MKWTVTIAVGLTLVASNSLGLGSPGPRDFSEIAAKADVIIIGEVLESQQVRKTDTETVFETRFAVSLVLKGDFTSKEWTFRQDIELPILGDGHRRMYFSSLFRDEYLIFLSKTGDDYMPCTGKSDAYSFRRVESYHSNCLPVRVMADDTIQVGKANSSRAEAEAFFEGDSAVTNVPLAEAEAFFRREGVGQSERGINLFYQQSNGLPTNAWHKLKQITERLNCPFWRTTKLK